MTVIFKKSKPQPITEPLEFQLIDGELHVMGPWPETVWFSVDAFALDHIKAKANGNIDIKVANGRALYVMQGEVSPEGVLPAKNGIVVGDLKYVE